MKTLARLKYPDGSMSDLDIDPSHNIRIGEKLVIGTTMWLVLDVQWHIDAGMGEKIIYLREPIALDV